MRRRHLVRAVGGLGAVGFGGCLRLASSDGTDTATGTTMATDESTAATTITDIETATDEPKTEADSDVSYPTGLDDEGVYAYLVDNHVNALLDTTFTENWTVANRTRAETMETVTVTVDDGRALMERGTGVDLEVFYDDSGGYWREDLGSRATFGEDRRGFDVAWVTRSRRLRQLVTAGSWAPPTPTDDGFEVAASGVDDATALEREFEAASVESFEASGVVTPEGVLAELTVSFEFVPEDEERLYEVRTRHRVSDVGTVSVNEPSWLGTARERAPEVSLQRTDDGQFLVFEHLGGNPIESGTNVVLYDRENRENWGYRDNQTAFEPGDVVYVWMENDRLRWNVGGRPGSADPQPLDRRLAFWMHRHGAEYFGHVELGA